MTIVSKGNLVFEDNFDNLSLSGSQPGTWKSTYYWGDRSLSASAEKQVYVDAGFGGLGVTPHTVKDGVLTITADKASQQLKNLVPGAQYSSGLISSEQSFAMQYGYFEMSAQLPMGKGLWPAFWMLPIDGDWPPELDIVEMLGHDPSTIYATAHTKDKGSHSQDGKGVHVADTSKGFHTYAVDWNADTITWYFDGEQIYQTVTPDDMKSPMYMIANLAVGGYWPGDPDAATFKPSEFKIDYIRAYQHETTGAIREMPLHWAALNPGSDFSSLDHTNAPSTYNFGTVMSETQQKVQLVGDWARFVKGNDLDNYIGGSNAQYNEIDGWGGNDVLRGNGGIDVFVVRNGFGNDTILDLSAAIGNSDKIDLIGFNFSSFDEVKPWLIQSGQDVILRLGESQGLLLKNTTIDMLRPEQFVFTNVCKNSVIGNVNNEKLTGSADSDAMLGRAGADSLIGGAGKDLLYGGDGNDTLDGGTGADVLYGGKGNDRFVLSDVNKMDRDFLADWSAGDVIDLSSVDANATHAGRQAFTWIGAGAFTGKAGELHSYFDGANSLIGGDIDGDGKSDFQIKINGKPALTASDFIFTSGARPNPDTETPDSRPGTIGGTDASEALLGTRNADTIYGVSGDDTLNGLEGRDVLYGGAGNDTFSVSAAGHSPVGEGRDVIADWGRGDKIDFSKIDADSRLAGNQSFTWLGDAAFTTKAGQLRSYFDGTNTLLGADVDGDGKSDFQLKILGKIDLSASDFVKINKPSQTDATPGQTGPIKGSNAAERLVGTLNADTIYGFESDDTLNGLEGKDKLYGGAGNDTFVVSSAAHSLGQGARDVIADWNQGDKIDLSGIDANSKLAGSQGFTWLGDAALSGKAGQLRSYFDGTNTLLGGDIDGDGKSDFQIQVNGHVVFSGSDFLNVNAPIQDGTTRGTSRSESLVGTAGADRIYAFDDNDRLNGLEGKDVLYGGAGNDVFVFSAAGHTTGGVGRDVIADWNRGDKIDLSGIDASSAAAGKQAFTWLGDAAFTSKAGQLHSFFDGTNTLLGGDVNGDGRSDFQLQINGRMDLSASDFL